MLTSLASLQRGTRWVIAMGTMVTRHSQIKQWLHHIYVVSLHFGSYNSITCICEKPHTEMYSRINLHTNQIKNQIQIWILRQELKTMECENRKLYIETHQTLCCISQIHHIPHKTGSMKNCPCISLCKSSIPVLGSRFVFDLCKYNLFLNTTIKHIRDM